MIKPKVFKRGGGRNVLLQIVLWLLALVFVVSGEFYRVLSVYKKSYNKWRIEESATGSANHWVHLQKVHNAFDAVKKNRGPFMKCMSLLISISWKKEACNTFFLGL